MRSRVRRISAIFRLLAAFYPSDFLAEFGEEMNVVNIQVLVAADERGRWAVTAIFLRELRGLVFSLAREHWDSRAKKESPMTILKKPAWTFYSAWVIFTMLSVPLSFILNLLLLGLLTKMVGGFIYVNGVRHITEDYLGMYFFIPILGLSTGALQYGVLRHSLPRMVWWVLSTAGGWIAGLLLIAGSGWLNVWTHESFVLDWAFIVLGLSIGLGQWLLLRRRLPRAGWWIGANLLGWGLLSLMTGSTLDQFGLLGMGILPACVTAVMLALLINHAQPTESHNL